MPAGTFHCLSRWQYWVCCGWLWLGATGSGAAAHEITTLGELRRLSIQETEPGVSLRLKGVVVCYDAGWHQLYLHDGETTEYFNADQFHTQPACGQWVEITGLARATNRLAQARLSILGQAALPPAKKLAISELARDHGEWVEINGRLLSTETSRGRPALLLHDRRQNCLVYILGEPLKNDFKQLLGCKVRVRGINASKSSGARLDSALLFAPGLNEVTVLEPASAQPSTAPVVSIGALLNRELGPWTNDWVDINGLVVSYQPGQSLVIKDPTGIIRARVVQLTEMPGDERVDAWGFLEAGPQESFLNHAYFEVARPASSASVSYKASPYPADNSALPALTNISDILKLGRDQAARHLPVRLRGVLTYADAEWRNGFLQERGEAIYVDLDTGQKDLRLGQWVELTGQTSPGGFAPEVLSTAIQVVGMTNLPAPVRVDLEDLANGHLDAHWVEMQGVVRRVEKSSGHLVLILMTPKGRFKVIVPGFESQPVPSALIDALVSVRGACTSELNIRRQLSGITLHAQTLEQVRVLEPPPADPFAIETTRIDAVATFDPNRLSGRRVKVQGVVTLRLPGQGFIVQDATGGMRVLARQPDAAQPGDAVEVLGFPAIGDFSPYLEEAVFRKTAGGVMPAPASVSADQVLLHGTNDARMITLTARLLQSVPRSASPQLVLQDGPIIFTAHLDAQARQSEVPALESGSLLRLTGVCAIQGGSRHEPESFRLLLRQPGDVQLLATPPWWTPGRALALAAGMMLAVTGALAWIALLRRQVRRQTDLIRQKLENEAALEERYRALFENANDMLYTHDASGRLTSINQIGERLLQQPRDKLLQRNLIDFIAEEQRSAARQWLDNVFKGTAPTTVEWDFVTGSGQRVKLELSTRLIEEDGQLLEVEGIARDITERRRLERELLEISNREQRRIGHDLHDGVCQQLAGIAFLTANLADELQEKGAPEAARLDKLGALIKDVVEQTRNVARGLFPVRLAERGLVAALEELAANAAELFKIDCRFVCSQPPSEVETSTALHLYYIVLEAIANASKHGAARNVVITLEPAAERFRLSIEDDGRGFKTQNGAHTGMGIRIMHYRARVIGGSLHLQTHPGSGTTVTCLFLPVPDESPEAHQKNSHHENGVQAEKALS